MASMNPARPAVLIVEDEVLLRMDAADLVEEAGFAAIEAADADEAVAILEARPDIALLFTDVNMPGDMNGIDLAEHLKRLNPELHLIITSALPVLRPVNQLPALFVAKPYHADEVGSAASRLLAA